MSYLYHLKDKWIERKEGYRGTESEIERERKREKRLVLSPASLPKSLQQQELDQLKARQ